MLLYSALIASSAALRALSWTNAGGCRCAFHTADTVVIAVHTGEHGAAQSVRSGLAFETAGGLPPAPSRCLSAHALVASFILAILAVHNQLLMTKVAEEKRVGQ